MITNLIKIRTLAFLLLMQMMSLLCWGQSSTLDFDADQLLCTVNFTLHEKIPTEILSYHWDFGDGSTSMERNPVHQYGREGKFGVTVTITYLLEEVVASLTKSKNVRFRADRKINFTETTVSVESPQFDQVVDAEMYSYTDQLTGHVQKTLVNEFSSGNRGIWKRASVYKYRHTDNGIASFDWKNEKLGQKGWIATEVRCRVGSSNQGLEIVNSQNVYTSTLFDRNQQHAIAHGINMRYDEMAFTGFEDQSLTTGNWTFSSQPIINRKFFTIASAYKNFVLVEASPEETKNIDKLNVLGALADDATNTSFKSDIPVACHQEYEKNSKWSVLVLGQSPFDGLWTGHVQIETTVKPATPGLLQDNEVHHSGTSSLRVVNATPVKQELLHLSPSKEYVINLWGSTLSSRMRNTVPDAIGVELTFYDRKGQLVKTEVFKASGAVVEGWQQIDGAFVTPEQPTTITVSFLTKGVSWYDDLRLFPSHGNMTSFVYETIHGKQSALLDENNRATYYFYAADGSLYQEKKETDDGVKTVTERISYTKSNQQ